jgi:uncharacterized membrane protein
LSGDLRAKKTLLFAVAALVALGILLRVAPHPDNFAPITAIALIGGATLGGRWAWSLPLAIMVVSDTIIGFHDTIAFTWGSFLLIGILSSRYLAKRLNFENVLAASMLGAVLFFVVTNFGVWLMSGYYDNSVSGLLLSYENAIPFFRNTFLGDIAYSTALYGAYVLVTSKVALPAPFKALSR